MNFQLMRKIFSFVVPTLLKYIHCSHLFKHHGDLLFFFNVICSLSHIQSYRLTLLTSGVYRYFLRGIRVVSKHLNMDRLIPRYHRLATLITDI